MWLTALAGCPWISSSEHDQNQKELQALLDGDADTDADSDTDVDSDTDADTDPGPCVEDGYEPNDTLLTLAPLVPPTTAQAVVCAENVSPVFGYPLDLYSVEVGPTDVLDVAISADGVPCDELGLSLQVTDEAGVPFPAATGSGCPSLQVGWGADQYLVWVSGTPTADAPYLLDVSTTACRDTDDDGFLAATCGGPDCSDLEGDRYPGATEIPLDGTDQDCDGGDELESGSCPVVLASAVVAEGTLPCTDLVHGAAWDRWQVPSPTSSADGLSIVVQNGGKAADLLALVVAADGDTHYGLQPDRSQLDDEVDCAVPAWTGETRACPGACVWNGGGPPLDVWVAQYPGSGCQADAEYTLVVYSDGVAVTPVSVGDGVVLGF